MTYPKLSTPPIIESIFLVRFKESLDKELIEKFCNELLTSNYGKKDTGESTRKGSIYVLRSSDNNKTVRVNLDSLSLHNLNYLPFEEIYTEFKTIIGIIAALNDGLTIELLSVRYVNSIQITNEEGTFRLEDYLTYKIDTPFPISNFFLQLLVKNEIDSDMEGVVIQTIRPKNLEDNETKSGIFLDISVRKKTDFKITESDQIKDILFLMRDFKNDLFFKVVKPEILQKYA